MFIQIQFLLVSHVFLPPANELWGKVMFLHLCVILFTEGEGVCPTLPGCWLDRPPMDADSPGCGRPPRVGKTPRGWEEPLDSDPLELGRPPNADPPRVGQTPPRCRPSPGVGQTPRMQTPHGFGRPPAPMQNLPQGWAEHPTGMHTCFLLFFSPRVFKQNRLSFLNRSNYIAV